MTLDEAIALSLFPGLARHAPRGGAVSVVDRLRADDPALLDEVRPLLGQAREARENAARQGMQVMAWDDPRYPAALLAIPDPPTVLWYRGLLDALDAPAVALVGSRAASAAALETAARLGADLSARGITVVSGLARGVDSAAHRGALRTGRTVAVLGSGLDRIYPAEHAALARDILVRGAIFSEHPPGTPPLPFHFPRRNRIISGLSRAVVVIEAGQDSGSLITASCALEQGREVMAVPGNVLSGRNRGAHALIRDGAKIVETVDDIVEELGWTPHRPESDLHSPSGGNEMSSVDPLLRIMETGHAYDLDALAGLAGVAGVRLLPRLLELELLGLVRRVGGGRFLRPA